MTIFPELAPLLANLNANCDYYLREASRCEQQRLSRAPQEADEEGGGGADGDVDTKADDTAARQEDAT